MHLDRALLLLATAIASVATGVAADSERDGVCTSYVSKTNSDAGVAAFHDPKCLDNLSGVGCFETTCRFCRSTTSEQSKFFKPCDPMERAKEDQALESSAACVVSSGDQAAGISAFYDATCPGLGCQADNCRFCKMWETSASKGFASCPNSGTAPTPVATAAPASAPVSESDACASAVAASGLTSVSFVTESKCNAANPRYTGCVANTKCQLCRSGKNEANQYLISCKVLQDSKQNEALLMYSAASTTEALELQTNLADNEGSVSDGALIPSVVGTVAAAAAAVLAVVAIWKTKKMKKERDFRGPCTPLNGSLISLETCVSNL